MPQRVDGQRETLDERAGNNDNQDYLVVVHQSLHCEAGTDRGKE